LSNDQWGIIVQYFGATLHETRNQLLVIAHAVMGVNVHDARLVAAMLVHGLTHILTFNTADFRRFSQITVVHPSESAPEPEQVQD